jgi:hypothetical protein
VDFAALGLGDDLSWAVEDSLASFAALSDFIFQVWLGSGT